MSETREFPSDDLSDKELIKWCMEHKGVSYDNATKWLRGWKLASNKKVK